MPEITIMKNFFELSDLSDISELLLSRLGHVRT